MKLEWRWRLPIIWELPLISLEGLMLKLKLQYFGHLMWRADSFEKTLMLGKIEGRRRRGRQRMRWLDGITDSMEMSLGDVDGVAQSRTQLSNWNELNCWFPCRASQCWWLGMCQSHCPTIQKIKWDERLGQCLNHVKRSDGSLFTGL